MDKILLFFNNNKDAFTAMGIFLTLGVSVFSLYFSIRNNKAVHYVNSVAKNRVEWINALRNLCAEYIGAVNIYDNSFFTTDSDADIEKSGRQLAHAKELCCNIKLMLNFLDKTDMRIIKVVDELMEAYSSYYHDAFECEVEEKSFFIETPNMILQREVIESRINELSKLLQIYLKSEWNRVKYESKGKSYEKATQEFDIWELEQKYDNSHYKNEVWKRFCINTKAKARRIWNSSGFAVFIFCLSIIILAGFIIA